MDALRIAGGDGRLTAEELDTRLEIALSARTLGELAGLTASRPAAPVAIGTDGLSLTCSKVKIRPVTTAVEPSVSP